MGDESIVVLLPRQLLKIPNSFFPFLHVFDDLHPHGSFGGNHRRNFQHGNEARALVYVAVQMTAQRNAR
jgi:hypothetical protein